MFGMSMAEIAVILVLALVILGPEKLPDLARTLGKTIREIRRAGNQIRDAIMFEDEMREFRSNNRSITRSNTSPSTGYVAKEYGHDDMMDGPFDQLDDEEWGTGGALTYDPDDYHHREQTRFEINMKAREETQWHAAREVELTGTDFSPPADPSTSASLVAPEEVPHIDIREVHIHEQVEDIH